MNIELELAQDKKDLSDILATDAGIRFLSKFLITDCQILCSSFIAESPKLSDFIEGQRALGLKLFKSIAEIDKKYVFKIMNNIYPKTIEKENEDDGF